jgi:hypothetical protein
MPADGVSGAVSVRPHPRAQPPHLTNQRLARHPFEIVVHVTRAPSLGWRKRYAVRFAGAESIPDARYTGQRSEQHQWRDTGRHDGVQHLLYFWRIGRLNRLHAGLQAPG